jgi:hypothetical protein
LLKIEDMVYFIGCVCCNFYDEYGKIIIKRDRKEKYAIYSFTYDYYDEGNVISVDEKE